ncbi:sensor domain-containing diguanylate cyclase [Alcanivorax sp. S6407]|uniref:GGDEF domain-containing protein n=1 Tax=Alcanivorax sp. S6407 TaxID=2926424 RepID=UPI001FF5736E|nr:sensor domain-containing diguanylate cyclase [Alcanivorax sp. S6407]MCK0154583.1 sensor domain-containing diguanylate cyclase [Alcanivorax sp. S6407]
MSSHPYEPDLNTYRTLLESTKAIPWRIDWQTMTFSYMGPQIEEVLGWEQGSWKGIDDWVSRMHPDDQAWVVDFCVSQSQSGVDHEADYRALTSDGEYVWIRDVVHVVRREDGEVEALVGFMFDITERKQNEQELERLRKELEVLSFQDGLTELGNRRLFDQVLAREWGDARRKHTCLSLILVDVDHFKQYNDHYGHLAGDDCLKAIAAELQKAAVRPRDMVARFGGEEFAIILPETDAAAARVVAERCRAGIESAAIAHSAVPGDKPKQVTISLGVNTCLPSACSDINEFLDATDRQMYAAKRQGRNQVACADAIQAT